MTEGDKNTEASPATEAEPSIPFAEFLESVPPAQMRSVGDVVERKYSPGSGNSYYEITTPEILLHCPDDICNGPRIFRFKDGDRVLRGTQNKALTYLTYVCSNCRRTTKVFSLYVSNADTDDDTSGSCYKFGEHPSYGPPTPNRLLKLFGKDREIFLKGRQCENHGLGIGAFVYYRRVVENHKDQILDEIIKVAEKIAPETVEQLKSAKKENQFSKAIESVKDAIPQALLINGQNPLTLLHSALSEGLHALTDAECLELAHDVRVVLSELAERLGQALKDEVELGSAVSRLTQRKMK